MELSGKTAVVTGGSRGIGEAIVYELAKSGMNVAVVYAGQKEKAEAVCESVKAAYQVKVEAYQCDVSDFNAVKELAAAIKKDFGTVHVLVNNAGITRDGLSLMMKEEDFDRVLSVNLKGAFNTTRHFAGMMMRNKEGAIINISSVSGLLGNAGQINYAASKAGLVGLSKTTARELAAKGIRCNVVAPGFIETDMTQAFGKTDDVSEDGKAEKASDPRIPLGCFGKPSDVAEAVLYLASASYVTGEVLRVDGGMAM